MLFDSIESLSHVINQESHVYLWNLGKIYLVHFLKFWNLPCFAQEISKFQKSELSKFIPNFPLKHMWLLVLICCIFSEHPFLWTPLDSCFCCIPTLANQSFILHESRLNLSHNGWFFAKYVLFICWLLQFKPSLHYFHCYVIFSYRKYLTAMQWFRAGNV